MSGARRREEFRLIPPVTIEGVLYDKSSKPEVQKPGLVINPDYLPVALNNTYFCIDNGSCNGHLYVLPTTPGSPSNFGFVTYNSTYGFNFEALKRPAMTFKHLIDSYVPSVEDVNNWDAFGYNNNRLLMLRSKSGQYAMFSFEADSITKMAEFPERTDVTLKGIVPVPNRNGSAPTWALAYSDRKNGLYAVELSGENNGWVDKKQASRRAGIIGGAVGGVAAVIVIILTVFFWRRKRNQKKSSKTQTQDEPQLPENNHSTPVEATGMKLPADNNEVKGNGHLPKIEETSLQPLPHEALPQSQHPQPYTQPYSQQYPQEYSQQYLQPAPYLAQPPQQPFSSTIAYTAPPTAPPLVLAPSATPTISSVANNSVLVEAVQQEFQFSNHPRPNVVTTVSGTHP
ncbi:hypothetical protein BGW41_006503 [Actinomortierella wolfii]|nr:hypothetical protein BGW41_006503 [Actinomortierella wolfii]